MWLEGATWRTERKDWRGAPVWLKGVRLIHQGFADLFFPWMSAPALICWEVGAAEPVSDVAVLAVVLLASLCTRDGALAC